MRRHILEKCIELFSGADADRQTMDEIARYCSITKPTLYSYFSSKEAILFALFNEIMDRMLKRLRDFYREYGGDRSSWDCFQSFFGEIIDFFHSHREILLILMRETHRAGSGDDVDAHMKMMLEKREEVMALFEEVLTPMITDESMKRFGGRVAAISVFQIISGILTEFFHSDQVNVEQFLDFLKELFQKGIFKKEVR